MRRTILIGVVLVITNQLFAVPELKNDEVVLPSAVAGQPFEYDLHQQLKNSGERADFTLVYPPDFPTWLSITKDGVLYGTPAVEAIGNYVFEVMATTPGDRDSAHLSTMITVTDPTAGVTPLDRMRP